MQVIYITSLSEPFIMQGKMKDGLEPIIICSLP